MDPNLNSNPQAPAAAPPPDPGINVPKKNSLIKKLIVFVAIFFVLILILVAGIFVFGKIKQSSAPKDVTLVYWGLFDDIKVMEPIISDFEKTHPNIKIQYEKQDIKGLGQYVDRLTTRIKNGNGPDIIRFHSSWTLQLKNYLLPFPKAVVDNTQLDKDFYKTVERDMKVNGAYYGIPLGVDTLAMFVNTKLLEAKGLPIPQYWSDIYEKYAPELVVKDDSGKIITPSIALGTYDNIAHAPDIAAMLLLQNGADLYDLSAKDGESAIGALKFYTSFSDGKDAVWDDTLDNSTVAFSKGNLAIYFGYSWDIFSLRALNPTLIYKVVKVPSLADRNNTVSSYWAEGVNARTKHSKEAFEFLTYLSSREALTKLNEMQKKVRPFGNLYPRKSMAPLLSSNELVYPFIAQADNAQSTFFTSDTNDGDSGMISQMDVYMGNAIKSINNNTSVSTAVETLAKGVDQVLSQYK